MAQSATCLLVAQGTGVVLGKAHLVFRKKQVSYSMNIAYWKYGTHARVFSQTLAHGYNKNEIRQRHEEDGKKWRVDMKNRSGTKNISHDGLTIAREKSVSGIAGLLYSETEELPN